MNKDIIENLMTNTFNDEGKFIKLLKELDTKEIRNAYHNCDYVNYLKQFGFVTYGMADDDDYVVRLMITLEQPFVDKYEGNHLLFINSSYEAPETNFLAFFTFFTYLIYYKDDNTNTFLYEIKSMSQLVRNLRKYSYSYQLAANLFMPLQDFSIAFYEYKQKGIMGKILVNKLACDFFMPYQLVEKRIKELRLK